MVDVGESDDSGSDVRENAPGCCFPEKRWQDLVKRLADSPGSREPLKIPKGQPIVQARADAEEVYFVHEGVVACQQRRTDGRIETVLLRRGAKFLPTRARDAPVYRALTDVSAHRLREHAKDATRDRDAAAAREEWRTLKQEIGDLDQPGGWLLEAVRAFRAHPALGHVSAKLVMELVKLEAVPRVLERGAPPSFLGESGLYYLAEGELLLEEGEASPSAGLSPDPDGARAVWRSHRLTEGNVHAGSLRVKTVEKRSVLVCVPQVRLERFLRSSPSFRRQFEMDAGARKVSASRLPQFVLFASLGLDLPIDAFTSLTAEAVAQDFKERTLVLQVAPGAGKLSAPAPWSGTRAVDSATVGIEAFNFSDPSLRKYHAIFLAIELELRDGPGFVQLGVAWERMDPSLKTRVPLTLVLVTGDPYADLPSALHPLREGRKQRVVLMGGGMSDLDPVCPPSTIRLRFNPEELRHVEGVALASLPLWMRESLSRLARGVTDRQVGVALSGGGAWAFAHMALLEAMHAENIPVDLVSGCSGGSLVGAYYCALGREGLARLRGAGPLLELASLLSATCSSRALAWAIQLDLEGRRLRDLDVPFFAVVADVGNGVEFIPRRGGLSLADCVRASSTLVPFMGKTDFEGRRCADGLYVNNVGERVLAEEGADLIVSSDVVQAPGDQPIRSLLDLVYRIRRIRDGIDANFMLVRTANDRDRFLADCTFRPRGLSTSPAGLRAGPSNEVAARPQAESFVQAEVKPRWERLCRSR